MRLRAADFGMYLYIIRAPGKSFINKLINHLIHQKLLPVQ